jgi:hypothetical protein
MRFPRFVPLFVFLALSPLYPRAQSPDGNINGLVSDPSSAAVVGAEVVAVNDVTGVQYTTKSNREGIYVLPNLPPGPYRIQVSKAGLKTVIKPDIVLNVQDALSINFTLPLGAIYEVLTVQGGASLVNTESASVSTVIDRQLVEDMPLNGRSFNTLLQLTPGVVIAPSTNNAPGQFSIAGQRTDANTFTIDGVSANFGATPSFTLGQSGTGTAQAFSALGGTSSLVSVEALEQFRVETSSFAPEFGRSPGGQVVLTTRSGTNAFHGGLYEYFRNDVLDANDWFANQAGLPRAEERHNDFGAFLGGRIIKDKTFFFASYEGARLRLPQTAVVQVPSSSARADAPAELAPFLDAYPQPNGLVSADGYSAQFTGTYSDAATLNAGSLRIDHVFNDRFTIFGRFNDAPSQTRNRVNGLSEVDSTAVNTKTTTVGANLELNSHLANSLRGNYSTQRASLFSALDRFDGATPLNASLLLGSLPPASNFVAFQTFDASYLAEGASAANTTRQINVVDDTSFSVATHLFKFGVDVREIFLNASPPQYAVQFSADSVQSFVSTGTGSVVTQIAQASRILTRSTSLFAQDTWKVSPRVTLTYGVRWELNPAPSSRGSTALASWENVTDPSSLTLAPPKTALWATRYDYFAPRLGIAYSLDRASDLVLRVGWGLFYDLGLGQVASLASAFPNSFSASLNSVAVPITNVAPYLPSNSVEPPYPGAYGFSPTLVLPRSYQWNIAIEKSFSGRQAVSATYVGQAGRNLLRNAGFWQPNADFSSFFYLTTNSAFANYDSLQVQFRRPLSSRVQALLSYSWAHSLDNSSNDVVSGANTISGARDYASSDFDVRQSFSGAVRCEIPSAKNHRFSLLTEGWSLDGILVARTGFPFNGLIFVTDPALGFAYIRPNNVPGIPYWMSNPTAAGGRSLNPAAFSTPAPGLQGTEPRNDISGFGLTQFDASLGRKFNITDRVTLQFKADAFNVLNHPNFENPQAYVQYGPFFLQSQQMLNHGLGGLNPLFQEGGPRSLQLSLRLAF